MPYPNNYTGGVVALSPTPVGYMNPSYQMYTYPQNIQQNMSIPQAPITPYPQMPVKNQNVVWVQGRAGAEAYQVEPGTRIILLDSTSQTFYIKEVSWDGRPLPLMVFKYEAVDLGQNGPETMAHEAMDMSNYVTKDDFNKLMSMYEETKKTLENLTSPKEASNGNSFVR